MASASIPFTVTVQSESSMQLAHLMASSAEPEENFIEVLALFRFFFARVFGLMFNATCTNGGETGECRVVLKQSHPSEVHQLLGSQRR
jgi:hypothetical protein